MNRWAIDIDRDDIMRAAIVADPEAPLPTGAIEAAIQAFSGESVTLRAAGRTVAIRVLGLAVIADDVTPELALATIESVEVLGALRASPAVKAALRPRTV